MRWGRYYVSNFYLSITFVIYAGEKNRTISPAQPASVRPPVATPTAIAQSAHILIVMQKGITMVLDLQITLVIGFSL